MFEETEPCSTCGYSSVCVLEATLSNPTPVTGTVEFVEMYDGNLNVTVTTSGLMDGDHAFHVHTYGDISGPYGMATGGHFIGECDECRPANKPQEVGLLNNGTLFTVVDGKAVFSFVETVAKLSGVNSIDGRSIIIHGNSTSASARVAQCVIGRQSGNVASPLLRPASTQATCQFSATASNPSFGTAMEGVVSFTADAAAGGVWVTYDVSGIAPDVVHGFHVHTWGDIESSTGMAVGGHFIGDCTNCRPSGPQEVGNLWDGAGLTTDGSGRVSGMRLDKVIQLEGVNNIVGRGLIIHGNGTMSTAGRAVRVAQCVIGDAAAVAATDCTYTAWSAWGACVCNGAQCARNRTRSVASEPRNGGTPCSLAAMTDTSTCGSECCLEMLQCIVQAECCDPWLCVSADVNCVVSLWGTWGSCSKACGGGIVKRTRTVITPASGTGTACPVLTQAALCNTDVCGGYYCCRVSVCETPYLSVVLLFPVSSTTLPGQRTSDSAVEQRPAV